MFRQISCSLLTGALLLSADTLVFRNGTSVEGNFLGADARTVRFAAGSHVQTYRLSDVESIRFTTEGAAAVPDLASISPSPGTSAPTPALRQTQLPAGTPISIRMIESADSARDSLGRLYRASVDRPVVVNGQTVIPRGADAQVALVDAQQSGRLAGRTTLTLDLRSVTVNSRTYDLASTTVQENSASRTSRSAKAIGGTAALGTIIGALAGGGRGAAIGAASGAAVGTGAEVLTSGQRVRVPAETRLTFALQYPVDLR